MKIYLAFVSMYVVFQYSGLKGWTCLAWVVYLLVVCAIIMFKFVYIQFPKHDQDCLLIVHISRQLRTTISCWIIGDGSLNIKKAIRHLQACTVTKGDKSLKVLVNLQVFEFTRCIYPTVVSYTSFKPFRYFTSRHSIETRWPRSSNQASNNVQLFIFNVYIILNCYRLSLISILFVDISIIHSTVSIFH